LTFSLWIEEKKIIYEDFFCDAGATSIFVVSSTTKMIFKVSQTEGEKEDLIGKFSFLQSEKYKKSSTVNSELTARKMDQPGKALREKNEF
jgi:hypothetical protein